MGPGDLIFKKKMLVTDTKDFVTSGDMTNVPPEISAYFRTMQQRSAFSRWSKLKADDRRQQMRDLRAKRTAKERALNGQVVAQG